MAFNMKGVILLLESIAEHQTRHLQSHEADGTNESESSSERGRFLTIWYLVIIGLCFFLPLLCNARSCFEERESRRLRRLLHLEYVRRTADSANLREETPEEIAIRKKAREANLARMFIPVRMTLQEHHFLRENTLLCDEASSHEDDAVAKTNSTEVNLDNMEGIDVPESNLKGEQSSKDIEQGLTADTTDTITQVDCNDGINHIDNISSDKSTESSASIDGPQCIQIPIADSDVQGTKTTSTKQKHRFVPNCCAICLTKYEVGDVVVWSSNPDCEHAYHAECIEQWLMKLKDDYACPCCRQQFVIDPSNVDSGPTDTV